MGATRKRARRARSRGRRAAVLGVAFATGVATLTWTQLGGAAPEAEATTPPVGFTADALPTWQTNGVVWAAAEQGGVVFAGGTFSAIRPPGSPAGSNEQEALNFAAFDAATGEPTGCKLNFTIGSGTATVRALDVSPDGRTLYAGGSFGAVNGHGVSSLAAIDIASCTMKPGFRPSVPAPVRALDVTEDTVYFGGDFTSVGGEPRGRFAAVGTGGGLLPWNPRADEPGRAVEVLPGGRVAIGGDFFTVAGRTSSHALAVVNASDGAVVRAYPGFMEDASVVKDITSDGGAFYTASEGTGGGVFDGRIALELDGGQRWRDTCLGATQSLVSHGSVLYSASHAHDCSSMGAFPDGRRRHFLAQSVNDPALLGWYPDTNDGISTEQIGPRAVVVASSGGKDYLWAGGTFTTTNGAAQQGLTRFASAPDTGAPFVPQVSVSSTEPGKVQVRWRSSVDLDDSELTYRVYRNGDYSTPVHTAKGSSSPWLRPQMTFTDTRVTAGQTYGYRVTATDAAGNTSGMSATVSVTAASTAEAYPAQVIADGPALYWRYDDTQGAYASDSSGADDSGVHLGSPTRAVKPGAVPGGGSAIGYTGGSTQYTYSDKPSGRKSAYSIETWFRTTTTRGGKLIGFGDRYELPSRTYDKHIYMTNSGRLVFGAHNGIAYTASTPGSYNDGKWHHVVATIGSGGMRLYVDGVRRATHLNTSSRSFTGYWRIGGDNLSGWPSRPSSDHFAGQIDETAVYHKVLTTTQIARHHDLGTP